MVKGGPNLLPVAPTIASRGPAGLGVLGVVMGVETVDTETGGTRRKKRPFFVGRAGGWLSKVCIWWGLP